MIEEKMHDAEHDDVRASVTTPSIKVGKSCVRQTNDMQETVIDCLGSVRNVRRVAMLQPIIEPGGQGIVKGSKQRLQVGITELGRKC